MFMSSVSYGVPSMAAPKILNTPEYNKIMAAGESCTEKVILVYPMGKGFRTCAHIWEARKSKGGWQLICNEKVGIFNYVSKKFPNFRMIELVNRKSVKCISS